MSQQHETPNENTFDVLILIKRLERVAAYRLRKLGCAKENECGHDVVNDLLPKHAKHIGDRIRLDHPAANRQEPFLYSSLRFAVLNKRRGCGDCKSETVPIIEEPISDDHDRSPNCRSPIDPQTPESLFSEVEMIDRVLSRIKNPHRRAAFSARVLDNYPYHEIAAELGVDESLVRKWVERDKKFLRKEFPTLESLWRDRDSRLPGLLT